VVRIGEYPVPHNTKLINHMRTSSEKISIVNKMVRLINQAHY